MKEFYELEFKDLVAKDYPNRDFSIYSPGQIGELKTNMMTMVLKLGVIMPPDVLGVVVNEMVEHLVLQEYHYICDLFETIDYNGFEIFDETDRAAFEDTVTVRDTGVMAKGESLAALKAAAGKGKKNGVSKKSARR